MCLSVFLKGSRVLLGKHGSSHTQPHGSTHQCLWPSSRSMQVMGGVANGAWKRSIDI